MSDTSAGQFVHLRVHSEYSLVDSTIRIASLIDATKTAGNPAVALTDQNNFFGMVKFYRKAMAAGIKPITGVDAWVSADHFPDQLFRIVLLAQSFSGYQALSRVLSRGYIEGQKTGVPVIEFSWLEQEKDQFIVLSGGRESDVGMALLAGDVDQAAVFAQRWQTVFGDRYYLEVTRAGRKDEERYLHAVVALAQKHGLPVVATNDVRFLSSDEYEAHEARVCITQGRTLSDPRRPRDYSDQQYLRTPDEMIELFSDLPEAIENTVEIARRCSLELVLGKNFLPDFPVPENYNTGSWLVAESEKGLQARFDKKLADGDVESAMIPDEYHERLRVELDVINGMDFPGYFLIVADFIGWARENRIPVGPGRGSGAGSLVAYALEITDLDPLKHELLFERFLNPERVSMPDFDVDFCMDRRDEVIDYVSRTYGRDRVSQIITYGSMKAKAVVRDVGRVLGHPYGFVDRIAKLIPFDLDMTLDKALEEEEELETLYREDEEVGALLDLARSLEGLSRNAGRHAGGVVIAPSVLTDFSPLYCEHGGGGLATQFDKDDVEAVGLVKFDFLGLRTLTIVDWAVETINRGLKEQGADLVDITTLPMDDRASFDLLKRAETTAVFQLESRGMKELIKRLQPDCFEDIVALVALFRPGPLQSGMVDDFVERKHGRSKVVYPHPDLEPILKPTYGVILYQEQVMQIAQVLANYSLGGADLLRRAMGKKKPEEMAKQREIFVEGAVKRDVDEKVASGIFDLMEKFAGYGFNKSHSAAYALVSYQTTWLKAHYTAAFMAAVLSADMDNTDKVVILIDECANLKLKVETPNVNQSQYRFTIRDNRTVIYGLGAIKGVGESALEAVILERAENGLYENLFDFCRRINGKKVNRRVLESLIRSGGMDCFEFNRASLMAQLPAALKMADQHSEMRSSGQDDLFGLAEGSTEDDTADDDGHLITVDDWDEGFRLQAEKETLGLYLTGHPINQHQQELSRFTSGKLGQLIQNGSRSIDKVVVVAGLVSALRVQQGARGRRAFLTIDDSTARIEVGVYGEGYNRWRDLIVKDKLLIFEGRLSEDDYNGGYRLSADQILTLDQAREYYAKCLIIKWDGNNQADNHPGSFINELQTSLQPFTHGRCPVLIDYRSGDARAKLPLGAEWRVHPTDVLIQRLINIAGPEQVSVEY